MSRDGETHARTVTIGVMGAGDGARARDLEQAAALGAAIAERGWILLTGGRNAGVMAAASRAARQAGGLTVGVLPGSNTTGASADVAVPIVTGMGHARNAINVLSADAVVVLAQGAGAGTWSEAMLAVKSQRPLCILTDRDEVRALFATLSGKVFLTGDIDRCLVWLQTTVHQALAGAHLWPIRLEQRT